jgi:hypothetical protein
VVILSTLVADTAWPWSAAVIVAGLTLTKRARSQASGCQAARVGLGSWLKAGCA